MTEKYVWLTFICIIIFFLAEFMIMYLYSQQHLIKIQLASSFFHLDWPWHSVIQFSSFHPKTKAGNKSIYYFQTIHLIKQDWDQNIRLFWLQRRNIFLKTSEQLPKHSTHTVELCLISSVFTGSCYKIFDRPTLTSSKIKK